METKLYQASPEAIQLAAELLRDGQAVGIPTETVYGLAADATNPAAVAKIFAAKGRPQDNPLIVHIADMAELPGIVCEVPQGAVALAKAFWPGPLTIIMKKSDAIPLQTSAGLDTVAVRMPSHPVAQAVIRASGLPLAAPSANLSGLPSPTTAQHTFRDMNGRIPLVLDGGPCEVGVESTVITLAGDTPTLLRPGYITKEQLEEVLGVPVALSQAILNRLPDGAVAASPGMKYKHYSPRADVIMLTGEFDAYRTYVEAHAGDGVFAMCYEEEQPLLSVPCIPCGRKDNPASQAHALFHALREADDRGAKVVYAHSPAKSGVSMAVYNRLVRAAAFQVIEL